MFRTIAQYINRSVTLILIGLIRIYQYCISPCFRAGCGFTPSCSAYALEAIKVHGALKGIWLACRRLSKCHPLHKGGFDPVPDRLPSLRGKH